VEWRFSTGYTFWALGVSWTLAFECTDLPQHIFCPINGVSGDPSLCLLHAWEPPCSFSGLSVSLQGISLCAAGVCLQAMVSYPNVLLRRPGAPIVSQPKVLLEAKGYSVETWHCTQFCQPRWPKKTTSASFAFFGSKVEGASTLCPYPTTSLNALSPSHPSLVWLEAPLHGDSQYWVIAFSPNSSADNAALHFGPC